VSQNGKKFYLYTSVSLSVRQLWELGTAASIIAEYWSYLWGFDSILVAIDSLFSVKGRCRRYKQDLQ
jgi:hypothetical protein